MSESAETERAIADFLASLADPDRHREIALRILDMERRLEQLEQELQRVDQRLTKARLDRWDVP